MAKKRERLEVIRDILVTIRDSGRSIKPTRLLHSSNVSPQMFKEYTEELLSKDLMRSEEKEGRKEFVITDKGLEFLEKYDTIIEFIRNFGL
jgi:predicted transcriptional regulator